MVKPKLLDQVLEAVRLRHLSYRTEQAYVDWIRVNFLPLPFNYQRAKTSSLLIV